METMLNQIKLSVLSASTLLLTLSCNNEKKQTQDIAVLPFELVVIDYNYSLAYSLKYVLNDKELIVLLNDEVEENEKALKQEKGNVLLDSLLTPNENLQKLSFINLDNLKELYRNICIMDGKQITVEITKDSKTKKIHLSNYYHPEIGNAIELINSIVPKKYQIHYDKEELLKKMEDCK